MRRPLVLGHRGAPHAAPQNTFESFRRAMELGADGFEFDVRRCSDGRLVCVHDPRIGICSVARNSYERLCSTRAGAQLPLLEDVLREFGGAWLDIELKVEGIEAPVLELAAKFCRPGRFVITSFSRRTVARLKELDAVVPAGWLFDRTLKPADWHNLRADYLAPRYDVLSDALAREAVTRRLRLITWTVNTPAAIRRVLELGVEIVISDVPDVAQKVARKVVGSPS